VIIGVLVYLGYKHLFNERKYGRFNEHLLGIIVGGALGNLINRVYLGYVIDFIVLKPFPVFNIADIGITLGLVILFLSTLRTPSENFKS